MMTSALALSQILALALNDARGTTKFLTIAAEALQLSGSDADVKALMYLKRAVELIRVDIRQLPFDEEQKAVLDGLISNFNPLTDLSQAALSLDQTRTTFLTPSHLVGLTTIHMALAGFRPLPKLDADIGEMSDNLRSLLNEISNSLIPMQIKKIIIARLSQVIVVLDNYMLFGVDELESETAALAGVLVIAANVAPEESRSLIVNLWQRTAQLFGIVSKANKAYDDVAGLVERVNDISDLLK